MRPAALQPSIQSAPRGPRVDYGNVALWRRASRNGILLPAPKRRVRSTIPGQTPTSIVLVMCLLLASCTSYTVVQIPDNIESEIHEGDTVKIVTKDGRDLEFKVVSVTSEGVIGENQQVIRFSDVAKLEKQEVSATKTAGLIVVGLAALFVILLVVAVSAFLSDYGSS
jgi:glucose dehydrogenase